MKNHKKSFTRVDGMNIICLKVDQIYKNGIHYRYGITKNEIDGHRFDGVSRLFLNEKQQVVAFTTHPKNIIPWSALEKIVEKSNNGVDVSDLLYNKKIEATISTSPEPILSTFGISRSRKFHKELNKLTPVKQFIKESEFQRADGSIAKNNVYNMGGGNKLIGFHSQDGLYNFIFNPSGDKSEIKFLNNLPEKFPGNLLVNLPNLQSLNGISKIMMDSLFLLDMPQLESLKGGPDYIAKDLYIGKCNIKTFDGFPKNIMGRMVIQSENPIYEIWNILKFNKELIEDFNKWDILRGEEIFMPYLYAFIREHNLKKVSPKYFKYYKPIF